MTTRVNVASDGTQANFSSYFPAISADGRFVAFESWASNLVAGDTNACDSNPICIDIFLHDRQTGETTRVSVDSAGGEANNRSEFPALTADGRFVAFQSYASNLVPSDTNGGGDVFVRDRQAEATDMVSVDSAGGQANYNSEFPAISADGRFLAFHSYASNLVAGDTNFESDVFVHDRQTGETTRVSLAFDGAQGNGSSESPTISADGRFVAFQSLASNLVPGSDTNPSFDVFVRDRMLGTTERVNVDSLGNQANGGSLTRARPVISADGRFVAFHSYASNLVAGDTNSAFDVFVHDRETDATTRASVDSGGTEANDSSFVSAISADGRFVVFGSSASNLVAGDSNNYCDTNGDGTYTDNCDDVFIHDRQTGITARVDVDSLGNQANGGSIGFSSPSISSDGRLVAFVSGATNLVAGDTNGQLDVFVHDLGDTDSDGEWDPFDPCPISADQTDSDGDLRPDACDGMGSGNVDCSPPPTGVSSIDALKVLRFNAALPVVQSEPCLDVGQPRLLPPPDNWKMGDVNCSGGVNAVDALLILRANAGLPVSIPAGCPDIKPP